MKIQKSPIFYLKTGTFDHFYCLIKYPAKAERVGQGEYVRKGLSEKEL
jgi:hypothetical protein